MRTERLDTGGEGDLFVFHSKPGRPILLILGALCAIFVVVAIVASDPGWFFVAAAPGFSALFAWPLMRWMSWGERVVSVTSNAIRRHKSSDQTEVLDTIEVDPDVPFAVKQLSSRSTSPNKINYYNVMHGDRAVMILMRSRHEAAQVARILAKSVQSMHQGRAANDD